MQMVQVQTGSDLEHSLLVELWQALRNSRAATNRELYAERESIKALVLCPRERERVQHWCSVLIGPWRPQHNLNQQPQPNTNLHSLNHIMRHCCDFYLTKSPSHNTIKTLTSIQLE